jgi:hypothetical protein
VGGDETLEKVTDPYGPSVWATTTNDIPLIVKGSKEFPASEESGVRNIKSWRKAWQGDTHEYTIHDVPEFYECRY